MSTGRIPWARPSYWGDEKAFVAEALDSSWISGGPFVERFEAGLSRALGAPNIVTTSNGTSALQVAYLGAGLAAGDEVVVPGFAFMAAANVALHAAARPVFADIDPSSWCVTAETIERVLSPRTKIVVPVHTYGNVCDLGPIVELCAARGVIVVEDAAEAFGSRYRGKAAGTIGELGTFSFQATKTLTTGEGGAVCARDRSVLERMSLYRNHGMLERRYFHEVAGHNFRLTNLQAALGCAQLDRFDVIRAERVRVVERYRARLAGVDGIALQEVAKDVDALIWAVGVRLRPDAFPAGRDAVMRCMADRGIETRPGFYPASAMRHLYDCGPLPISETIAAEVVTLPSFPLLTDDEIDRIVAALEAARA